MTRATRSKFARAVLPFCLGAAVSAAIAIVALPRAWSASQLQSIDEYTALLNAAPLLMDGQDAAATKELMRRMMTAHHRRDVEGEIAELAEDGYAWIKVSEIGYQELASGRDVAAAANRNFYASDHAKNYLGATAQPIAIVGNFGVQLEHENFREPDGQVKTTSAMTVYEVRQGKLQRLWAFTPTSADH